MAKKQTQARKAPLATFERRKDIDCIDCANARDFQNIGARGQFIFCTCSLNPEGRSRFTTKDGCGMFSKNHK